MAGETDAENTTANVTPAKQRKGDPPVTLLYCLFSGREAISTRAAGVKQIPHGRLTGFRHVSSTPHHASAALYGLVRPTDVGIELSIKTH